LPDLNSLYVHVPFCAGSCAYCDFYSVPLASGDSRPQRYIQTLLADARRLFETFAPAAIPSLYIGGGTPSVLGAEGIHTLLDGLLRLITRRCPPPLEITVEANPESADEAFLAAARKAGATRLSLGVQSFHGPSRRAVSRTGSDNESLLHRRLALAAAYFPAAFSADLISGLPFQSAEVLREDIDALLGHKPAHVSLYALTLEADSPLARCPSLPPPDEADHLWLYGRDSLEQAGYRQYEVSNFCPEGNESLHNTRYWLMQNWLALGPAASGTVIDDKSGTGFRYTIPPDVDAGLAEKVTDTLDSPALIKESFLMGFRYIEGPDRDLFRRRFKWDIVDVIPKTLAAWQGRGLLRKDKTALTREGLLFLDSFLLDAFKELDDSSSSVLE